MILTKASIASAVVSQEIEIVPYNPELLNPNSYNYRLGKILKEYVGTKDDGSSIFKEIEIPTEGLLLEAKRLYLGHTHEKIGSKKYMISLIGRSSVGRLGLFLQISANVGHTGTNHQWTLEIFPVQSIMVYPEMIIGQVSFWKNNGEVMPYSGYFGNFNAPTLQKG